MKNIGILDPDGKELNPLNGLPYSEQYKTLAKKWSKLPAYKHADTIISLINKNQVLLIISSTGSGKTVLLPKFALHTLEYKHRIVVTMPKQMIVKAAAEYSSVTLDVPLGKEVGYQYRGEGKHSSDTKILYATDGTLVSQLMKDPLLKTYDIVIIDEAHERKIQIDLLLFLLKNTLEQRPELKLIIMSATINEKIFSDYYSDFKYASFDVQGERIFPIKSIFTKNIISENEYLNVGYDIIKDIVKNDDLKGESSHDILFFVPSVNDTMKLCEMVDRDKLDLHCVKVYSGIRKDEQFIAQDKNKYKEFGKGRKLVMATNVAESSITIDGIKYVIDGGFEYLSSYDPILRAKRLDKKLITVAQAKQRMGRAGRTEPGVCYHLYTEEQFNSRMEKFPKPAIRISNLLDECVGLLGLKITGSVPLLREVLQQFIEPPPQEYVEVAITQMKELDLIDDLGNPTELCKVVIELGVETNVGVSLVAGYQYNCYREVLCIYILLEICHGKLMDIFSKPGRYSDKSLKRKFDDAFDSFKDSSGDHISLLKIIHKYFKLKTADSKNNTSEIIQWCRKHFLKYDVLKDTYDRFRSISYRIGDILKQHKGILNLGTGAHNDSDILSKSTSKRVMRAIELGFKNQIADKKKNNTYHVPHCGQSWNISNDSYLTTLPKKIIYHEIFVSGDKSNLNIVSKK